MTWWKWIGIGVLVGLVIGLLIPRSPAPVPVIPAVATTTTATARGGRLVVKVPCPESDVPLTVEHDCPEIILTTTATMTATCPPPPRFMIGLSATWPLAGGVDVGLRLGRVWVGPMVFWPLGGPVYLGGRIGWVF